MEDTVPGQLDAILVRLQKGDDRMNAADKAREAMDKKLDEHGEQLKTLVEAMAENTEVTKTVRDALTTARVGRTILIWLGGIAGAIAAIWGAFTAVRPH